MLRAYRMMLDFFGIELKSEGKLQRSKNWRERMAHLNKLVSVIYYCCYAQLYTHRQYRALILLGLALCLPSASVSLVFVVLYMYILKFFAYILIFTF